MKYGLGETLADYGFSFLEQLHSPIFLLHINGSVKKINEAGRKLIKVGHVSTDQIRALSQIIIHSPNGNGSGDCLRYNTRNKCIKVISKRLGSSEYLLVEMMR